MDKEVRHIDLQSRLAGVTSMIKIARRDRGVALLRGEPEEAKLLSERLGILQQEREDLELMLEALPHVVAPQTNERNPGQTPLRPADAAAYQREKARFTADYGGLRGKEALDARARELIAIARKAGPMYALDCSKFFSSFRGSPELYALLPLHKDSGGLQYRKRVASA